MEPGCLSSPKSVLESQENLRELLVFSLGWNPKVDNTNKKWFKNGIGSTSFYSQLLGLALF